MRNLSIDILKIILAFFVVFLHMHLLRDSYPELSFVLVNGVFRMAVPTFLIITGYYFYYVDNTDKLKKWLVRTFSLYVIWSIVYLPFWKEEDTWMNILFGYHHLWYLIGTFFSGIILFFIRKKSVSLLVTLILLLSSLGYGMQSLGNFHYFKNETDSIINLFPSYRNFLLVCFPFLTIGYLINRLNLDTKYKPSLITVLAVVGLVVLESFLNYKMISPNENIDLLFSLLIACPLVFMYCKNISVMVDTKILASLSTAIYLVHPLLMKWILGRYLPYETIIFIILLLVSSFILVFLNRKLKYLL
ncbi:acyltransferase family protein [Chryseobacterium paludis]|uniref:acyltransferase family protein n=1 Tax=Chryseobacterium paludis TaxID=2956784 RepID=UPI0021C1A12A|nr:acyltransferase family protein [Chryseobacterium paludis]